MICFESHPRYLDDVCVRGRGLRRPNVRTSRYPLRHRTAHHHIFEDRPALRSVHFPAGKLQHLKAVVSRALRPRWLAFPPDGVHPGKQHLFEAHGPGHHGQYRPLTGQRRNESPHSRLLADADTKRPNSGGAPAFLDFLEHELIPFIDRTYRTNTSDRGLLGHSLGGCSPSTRSSSAPPCFSELSPQAPLYARIA